MRRCSQKINMTTTDLYTHRRDTGIKHLYIVIAKASFTSHRTCMYVLVTEKNRLICKGPSRYTCDFITEFQGCRAPTMKIGMHIILCMHAVCLQTHPCLKGNLRET